VIARVNQLVVDVGAMNTLVTAMRTALVSINLMAAS